MREAARRGRGAPCDWRARRCPTVARPRSPRPGHFLSRHKGRFKYFGMLFGDISPAGGGERNAASDTRLRAVLRGGGQSLCARVPLHACAPPPTLLRRLDRTKCSDSSLERSFSLLFAYFKCSYSET